jgi:hypothetical protein
MLDIILKLIDLAEAGAFTVERANEVRRLIQEMQTEGRDPTQAEWEALWSRIDSNSARLDAADKRLNP